MDKPDMLWVSPDDMGPGEPPNWQRPWAETEPSGSDGETRYVRAGLYDALKAENAALREDVQKLRNQLGDVVGAFTTAYRTASEVLAKGEG